jgi:biopolymer transport protein ExbD
MSVRRFRGDRAAVRWVYHKVRNGQPRRHCYKVRAASTIGICLNHTKTAMHKGVYAMKSLIEVCLVGSILFYAGSAQESTQPAMKKGVSVQMPVADHAVEMREADAPQATVVAITADGKLFAGTEPTEPSALSNLSAGTVYVKADSRVPFQKVLTVLDALRGKSVVLLAAPPRNVERTKIVPPYGMEVNVSR